MARESEIFEVYSAGKLTVVGFRGQQRLPALALEEFRDKLRQLADEHNTDILAFDLSGVESLPSGMLGTMASLNRLGFQVYFFNPTTEVGEILSATQLDKLVEIHHVEIA